ncbi:hypothetical protein TRV_00537 [Trichophyton verrucosum HKI 0517]|uniref:Uncharacterized protein n=1 Tax=Trichophyton verrucosum (strain HKI 0517) TaxID=663202 RepID=D4D0E2_TRIVH|nr:uncharacterized protein TRV_00537 [Trichophyton verrucosum HKI 0517]EFE44687.1 hypothetical protein TRV_00537 [Trichophyton verrucosum HKI 0517]
MDTGDILPILFYYEVYQREAERSKYGQRRRRRSQQQQQHDEESNLSTSRRNQQQIWISWRFRDGLRKDISKQQKKQRDQRPETQRLGGLSSPPCSSVSQAPSSASSAPASTPASASLPPCPRCPVLIGSMHGAFVDCGFQKPSMGFPLLAVARPASLASQRNKKQA